MKVKQLSLFLENKPGALSRPVKLLAKAKFNILTLSIADTQQFGILRLGEPLPGINDRAIFIVDKQGKIVFSKTYELGQEPDYEELVTELGKVQQSSAA